MHQSARVSFISRGVQSKVFHSQGQMWCPPYSIFALVYELPLLLPSSCALSGLSDSTSNKVESSWLKTRSKRMIVSSRYLVGDRMWNVRVLWTNAMRFGSSIDGREWDWVWQLNSPIRIVPVGSLNTDESSVWANWQLWRTNWGGWGWQTQPKTNGESPLWLSL